MAVITLAFLFGSRCLFADEAMEKKEGYETKEPSVLKIDEETYQIGKVFLKPKLREIRFPATLNMKNDDIIEAAIVHHGGRVHESLLKTDISAINLNLAFKLLSVPPSKELFPILDKDMRPTGEMPDVSDEVKARARVEISVEWEVEGKKKKVAINEWIAHKDRKTPMEEGPWLYSGSYFLGGKFRAEISGDIVSIFMARPSLINYPGKDRKNDEVWFVREEGVPAKGTPITVIFEISPQRK